MVVALMGVSGAGKTTIGELLAARTGWRFIDADDLHPAANVAKMAAGMALEDADRYRERLLRGVGDARLVYLQGAKALIASRLGARRHRYMPASLLESQFAILEPPAHAITIDVSADPASCVDAIVRAVHAR